MVATMSEKRDKTGFGNRLRAVRTEPQMTQEQLAELVGMKSQNIARLESGGRTPGWDTVLKLAEALGVTPDAFLG